MKRNSQRGSAMLVSMILMAALLAGATVLVSLQLGSNRSTELTRTGISALYCAEAGLTATRATIAANKDLWTASLGTSTEPSWLSSISHDVDGDSVGPDFRITLDNTPDPNDSRIIITSTCLKYPDTPKTIKELVGTLEQSNCYGSQQGGCAGNNNMNSPL